jgi:hypothetical protein
MHWSDVTARKIDELVWTALTDASFCRGLLDGRRREILETFGFTDEERRVVLAVEADTLEAFANALCRA